MRRRRFMISLPTSRGRGVGIQAARGRWSGCEERVSKIGDDGGDRSGATRSCSHVEENGMTEAQQGR